LRMKEIVLIENDRLIGMQHTDDHLRVPSFCAEQETAELRSCSQRIRILLLSHSGKFVEF
jgi:hypothetical protein